MSLSRYKYKKWNSVHQILQKNAVRSKHRGGQMSKMAREYSIQNRKKTDTKTVFPTGLKTVITVYTRLPRNLWNIIPFAPYRWRLSSVALLSAVDGRVLSGEWQFWPGQAHSFYCLWTLQLLVQHRCLSSLRTFYPRHLK